MLFTTYVSLGFVRMMFKCVVFPMAVLALSACAQNLSGEDADAFNAKKGVGELCSQDVECDSSDCQGRCMGAPCVRNSDCAGETHCIPSIVQNDDNTTTIAARCSAVFGAAALGEPCVENEDCASGYCQNVIGPAYCSSSCKTSTDCPGASGPWVCAAQHFALDISQPVAAFSICQKTTGVACSGSSDCGAGEACRAWLVVQESFDNGQRISGAVETLCGPSSTGASDGQSCDGASAHSCRSGLCLSVDGNSFFCSAPCQTNEDCAANMLCGENNFIIFDQNTVTEDDDIKTSVCVAL